VPLLIQDVVSSVESARAESLAPMLDVAGFNFWVGPKQVLTDITMTVTPNRVLAVIGREGAGKTTLLSSLNRVTDDIAGSRRTGSITFAGQPLDQIKLLRQKIAFVSQKAVPFPTSVFENVAFGLRVSGVRHIGVLADSVEAALQQTGLWKCLKNQLNTPALALPAEQQQRLCLARAVATSPSVLLLDEPGHALTVAETLAMDDLIDDLRSKYTIVFVPHSLEQAARVSDETAFIHDGRLIEKNRTKVLFTAPRHKLTEDYITGRFG
jgi:phosphate transport system ATP-binding protein